MSLASWLTPTSHDARRSVDLVRVATAIVLLSHPLHAIAVPGDAAQLVAAMAERGIPASVSLAWAALALQLICGLGLLTRRYAALAALGSITVLAGGILAIYAPQWFVVGGAAEDGHPGMELNVLLIVCMVGVARSYWRDPTGAAADRGLEIIRVGSALSLVPHGAFCFLTWDVEGMREWGAGMSHLGFPCGVALVWSIKGLELTSALCRLARRLVVPACFGNLLIIVPGLWIAHAGWFDVGPGENGVEFSITLSVCAVACILAYWPVREARAVRALQRA